MEIKFVYIMCANLEDVNEIKLQSSGEVLFNLK